MMCDLDIFIFVCCDFVDDMFSWLFFGFIDGFTVCVSSVMCYVLCHDLLVYSHSMILSLRERTQALKESVLLA